MSQTIGRTRAELAEDLRALGVAAGDTLFVHSSFKSLGPIAGGAAAVVGALEDALGPEGLLLMPSFNLVEAKVRASTWNPATTPSTVGYLTEFFRKMPGTVRSDHYSHAVAARGARAAWIVGDHRRHEGYKSPWDIEPWGATYGSQSPMMRAMELDGKVLMLGVDYHSSTYMHVVEVTDWNRRLQTDPKAEYYWIHRENLGAWWDAQGRLKRGLVGKADCRLFGIRDFVESLCNVISREPGKFYKWYPK